MSYNILFTGEAYTAYPFINELDNTQHDDDFAFYFDENASYAKAVTEGYMSFKVINDKLITHTLYKSTRKLTKAELAALADYTQGQWSDGIGEGYEQNPLFESLKWSDEDGYSEVYISPWRKDQVISVRQEKAV